jgi:hypothetical protein
MSVLPDHWVKRPNMTVMRVRRRIPGDLTRSIQDRLVQEAELATPLHSALPSVYGNRAHFWVRFAVDQRTSDRAIMDFV